MNLRGLVLALGGAVPRIADDVYIAPGAMVIGDVEIGPGSSVWFNAVIRGDSAPIRIGAGTNIQDGAVLHIDRDAPCIVGDRVTIGHGAVVHGTTVEDEVTGGSCRRGCGRPCWRADGRYAGRRQADP